MFILPPGRGALLAGVSTNVHVLYQFATPVCVEGEKVKPLKFSACVISVVDAE